MRKLFLLVLAAAAAYYAYTPEVEQPASVVDRPAIPEQSAPAPSAKRKPPVVDSRPEPTSTQSSDALQRAFDNQQSNLQVAAAGVVAKVLGDDNDGSRHQRFIVKLASGQSILIAHNIGLAPRVSRLTVGDRVSFYGEYEWNNKGGVVHWTHRDPAGRHAAGWIKHQGQTYQ